MKVDLHVHSKYSEDGYQSVSFILNSCRKRRIGAVAITDHNSFAAYHDAEDNGDIIVIPGEEVSSSEGHILALGIDREIPRGMGVKETIDAIHEAGGVAIAAHPYRWWSGLGVKNIIPEFDGIEGRNGKSMPQDNWRSRRLAKRMGKFVTAGSDAHICGVGYTYLTVSDECKTWQEVLQEIKAGRVEIRGNSRYLVGTLFYVLHSVFGWMFRGFNKM